MITDGPMRHEAARCDRPVSPAAQQSVVATRFDAPEGASSFVIGLGGDRGLVPDQLYDVWVVAVDFSFARNAQVSLTHGHAVAVTDLCPNDYARCVAMHVLYHDLRLACCVPS